MDRSILQPLHPYNQAIGLVTSASPWGPWTPAGDNGLVLSSSSSAPSHRTPGMQVFNPVVLSYRRAVTEIRCGGERTAWYVVRVDPAE